MRFIDETGVNVTLTRRYGRALQGQRIQEAVPQNSRQQHSVISAMGLTGVTASFIIEGAVDTAVFNVYVEQVLRPTIAASDLLVRDNLAAHHASHIEEVARERQAQVLWLSPYSPDFSPIELLWSKIKSGLRQAKARSVEELAAALNKGLALITLDDCHAWFKHCGYLVAPD